MLESVRGDSRLGGSVAAFAVVFDESDAEVEFTLGLEDIPLRASGGSSRGGGVESATTPTPPVDPDPDPLDPVPAFAPDADPPVPEPDPPDPFPDPPVPDPAFAPNPEPASFKELPASALVDPLPSGAPFDDPDAEFEPRLVPEVESAPTPDPEFDPEFDPEPDPPAEFEPTGYRAIRLAAIG